MNLISPLRIVSIVLAIAAGLVACASAPQPSYSGFLNDYSHLTEQRGAGNVPVLRYVNPAFTPSNYNAILFEGFEFYPTPQPTPQVSAETLREIRDYATQALRQNLDRTVRLADAPGPGVARLRLAFTAVGAQQEGLKPYQYIPTAFVLTQAYRSVAGAPQQAAATVEGHVSDSQTGETLLAVVRRGTGERVKAIQSDAPEVTLDALKPLIDDWADAAAAEVTTFVQAKRPF
jgi:hypothetical protein